MLKNITLSAEEEIIKKAREKSHKEHTTLNATFRRWLTAYVTSSLTIKDYDNFMETLRYAKSGNKFTRDDLNER